MANLQDFQAAQARQNAAILNIAEDIKRQVEELQKGGLSADDEQRVYDEMVATATKLEEIAAVVPEPVVEEPGEEEPTEGEG